MVGPGVGVVQAVVGVGYRRHKFSMMTISYCNNLLAPNAKKLFFNYN
jgi:chromate transport protein ChrA